MTLRCKDGDIAIIVHDTPECADNLGRLVEVKGPPRWGIGYELVSWRIRPISAAPLMVDVDGIIVREVVEWESHVIHPDTWLMPIKSSTEEKYENSEVETKNPLSVGYGY
jgi:hypothetical protein